MSTGRLTKVDVLGRLYKIRTAIETLPGYSPDMKRAAKEHIDKVLNLLDEYRY